MAIKDITKVETHLFLCNGGSCKLLGAEESTSAIRAAISDFGLTEEVHTTKTLCNGRCKDGPIVIAQPTGIWFKNIQVEDAKTFVEKFIIMGVIPTGKKLYQYGQKALT